MYIYTFSGLYEDNKWWIPLSDMDGLFCIDKEGDSEYVTFFGQEKYNGHYDISKVFSYNDKLIFVHRYAFEVKVLSKKNKELETVRHDIKSEFFISNAVKSDNIIWIYPNVMTVPIIKLNLDNMEMTEIKWNLKEADASLPIIRLKYYENKVYFATRKENDIKIGILDCNTDNITYKRLSEAKYINCIEVSDNKLWALYRSKSGKTILEEFDLNLDKGKKTDLSYKLELSDSIKINYFELVFKNNTLFAFSTFENKVSVIDLSTEDITDVYGEKRIESEEMTVSDIQRMEDKIIMYSPSLGCIEYFDISKREIVALNYDINQENYDCLCKDIVRTKGYVTEWDRLNLEKYLNVINS